MFNGDAMRDKIIQGLNELLDLDHDAVSILITGEFCLSINSSLADHDASFPKEGIRMATALTIINNCLGEAPIVPVFEDGVIQRFE